MNKPMKHNPEQHQEVQLLNESYTGHAVSTLLTTINQMIADNPMDAVRIQSKVGVFMAPLIFMQTMAVRTVTAPPFPATPDNIIHCFDYLTAVGWCMSTMIYMPTGSIEAALYAADLSPEDRTHFENHERIGLPVWSVVMAYMMMNPPGAILIARELLEEITMRLGEIVGEKVPA